MCNALIQHFHVNVYVKQDLTMDNIRKTARVCNERSEPVWCICLHHPFIWWLWWCCFWCEWREYKCCRTHLFLPSLSIVVSSPGSPQELVSLVLVHAIQENILLLKMFSSYDAAEFLWREIQQYCNKPGADHFNGPITPQSCSFPIHILRVPSTLGEDTYNHIVPLWAWKCSCIDNDLTF